MKYKHAIEVLELVEPFTMKQLKKAYYTKALLYHPDKYKNGDEMFKDIHSSYEYLKYYTTDKDANCDMSEKPHKYTFNDIFTKSFFMEYIQHVMNIDVETIHIIESLLSKTSKLSHTLLNTINLNQVHRIRAFVKNYKNQCPSLYSAIHNLYDSYIKMSKNPHTTVISTLDDLLSSNLYVLEYNKTIRYVPMWHNTVYYDDCVVNIEKQLPSNIEIDNSNNVIYYVNMRENDLQDISNSIIIDFNDVSYNINVTKNTLNKITNESNYKYTTCFENHGILKPEIDIDSDKRVKSNLYFIVMKKSI